MQISPELRSALAETHSTLARHKLGHLHNLAPSRQLIKEHPEVLLTALERNAELVRGALNLSPLEKEVVRRVGFALKDGPYKSAYNMIGLIGRDRFRIINLAESVIDPGSEFYRQALDDLANRMTEGWSIKVDGEVPHDNDPDPIKRNRYDRAIWGHTRGALDPRLDVEFWAAHQVERIVSAGLTDTRLAPLQQHKDWLLNLTTARVCLDKVEGEGIGNGELFDIWQPPRPYGLKWISKARLTTYQQFYNDLTK